MPPINCRLRKLVQKIKIPGSATDHVNWTDTQHLTRRQIGLQNQSHFFFPLVALSLFSTCSTNTLSVIWDPPNQKRSPLTGTANSRTLSKKHCNQFTCEPSAANNPGSQHWLVLCVTRVEVAQQHQTTKKLVRKAGRTNQNKSRYRRIKTLFFSRV